MCCIGLNVQKYPESFMQFLTILPIYNLTRLEIKNDIFSDKMPRRTEAKKFEGKSLEKVKNI